MDLTVEPAPMLEVAMYPTQCKRSGSRMRDNGSARLMKLKARELHLPQTPPPPPSPPTSPPLPSLHPKSISRGQQAPTMLAWQDTELNVAREVPAPISSKSELRHLIHTATPDLPPPLPIDTASAPLMPQGIFLDTPAS